MLKLRKVFIVAILVVALSFVAVFLWLRYRTPSPGKVRDEAQIAGRGWDSFPAADEDYFRAMDRVPLTPNEVKGRNTWIVWTAGNDRMWDELAVTSFGAVDLLKTLSSHDRLGFGRHNRWKHLGLVNEPCFEASTRADASYRFGLRLDRRKVSAACGADPFEDAEKYPGVTVGSRRFKTLRWRGKDVEFGAGSYYGYATGIVGLRLFPNPHFDQAAADRWDPERFYADPTYYNDARLVRPYRVGMSCGFCHVGPNPVNPPPDPNAPEWQHLSSNVGAQYFRVDRILYWQKKPGDFAFQLLHSSRPGTLDTSFIATDSINNPRTMNAMYHMGPRLALAAQTGQEHLEGGSVKNRQFNDEHFANRAKAGPDLLSKLFTPPKTVFTPRVLKDGADSVGALGALNRVYLSIGAFSEEWLLHFNPLVGGKEVTPIDIDIARANSAYFRAVEEQTFDVALFFLKTTDPHYLKDAPGGAGELEKTAHLVEAGKTVFADNCARCHSSKTPPPPPLVIEGSPQRQLRHPGTCPATEYLTCWNDYFAWTETEGFKQEMRKIVASPDFLHGNYLSTDLRVPVTLLQTNACSPLATNAIAGNIWDNFSSQYYKDLPSVGQINWYHPVTGEKRTYNMPAGGRGYTRPPSLVSLWSTAPFLLNNTVGEGDLSDEADPQFDPSVQARLRVFDRSIRQMLWPETRDPDSNPRVVEGARRDGILGSSIDRVGGRLRPEDRSRAVTITASTGFLPPTLQGLVMFAAPAFPRFFDENGIRLGPIPAGTPIGLISNVVVRAEAASDEERRQHRDKLFELLKRLRTEPPRDIFGNRSPEPGERLDLLAERSLEDVDALLRLSKCPDLIVNRGHYFGSDLPPTEKEALIAFLKTM